MKLKICAVLFSLLMISMPSVATETLSINFIQFVGTDVYGAISTNGFGVVEEGSYEPQANWNNILKGNPDNNNGAITVNGPVFATTNGTFTTSSGSNSVVTIETIRPNGSGRDTTLAENYDGTAMRAFLRSYLAATKESHVTLSNLNAEFPYGYKVIAYLGGASQNTGMSVSLTEGTDADWDVSTDETYYLKTRYNPESANLASGFHGTLVRAIDKVSDVGSNTTAADYAVFYNQTADQITLTVDGILGGQAGLGGIQLVGYEPPNYYTNGIISVNLTAEEAIATATNIIYVGEGSFTPPYYEFFSDAAGTAPIDLNTLSLAQGNMYIFERLAGITTHPFHLGANWSPSIFTGSSSQLEPPFYYNHDEEGSPGLVDGDYVIVEIPDLTPLNLADQPIEIWYWCTAHPSMSGDFTVVDAIQPVRATEVNGYYGIPAEDSEVNGWINTTDARIDTLAFTDGSLSSVKSVGHRPQGSGYDETDNDPSDRDSNDASSGDSDNYDSTPFRGYGHAYAYTGAGDRTECQITLSNLVANFPHGYKIIAYLSGPTDNRGASVTLSTGGKSWANVTGNEIETYYYKTIWNPDGDESGFAHPIQTTEVGPLDSSDVPSAFPTANYAVFTNLTDDIVTLTVAGIGATTDSGIEGKYAGLAGYQIIGLSEAAAPLTAFETWLTDNSLVNPLGDADEDNRSNLLEYAAGQFEDPMFRTGKHEWPALIRLLDKKKSIYKQ